jgi:hypothetical protein
VLYIPFSEATPKHVVRRGKTPVLTEDQARRLLASIKVVRKVALGDGAEAEEPWLVGLRDRALMAVMTYTFARVSAVVAMRVEASYPGGKRWWCAFTRKAASATKCRRITSSNNSRRGRHPRERQDPPLPLGARRNRRQADEPRRRLWCAGARPTPASGSSSAAT